MKSFKTAIVLAVAILAGGSAYAQSRGTGRIAGKVVDEAGKPVADVVVKAQKVGETEVFNGKSNNKGEWTIARVNSGDWRLEFSKDGLETQQVTQAVDENDRSATMTVTMKKPAPAVDPTIAINEELKRAAGLIQGGDTAAGRKIYEDLAAKYPTVYQFPFFIATTYAADKDFQKALEYVKQAGEKDPNSVDVKLLHAEILMELGQKAEAKAMLDAVDLTQVKDPLPYINAAIIMINEGKGLEAIEVLNKLEKQFPTHHNIYYYRGRAYLSASKVDEAKVDLEKFVSVAPAESKEVAEAKKILAQMTKK
jgi:tetratricopeptide (TPR) repeat protein